MTRKTGATWWAMVGGLIVAMTPACGWATGYPGVAAIVQRARTATGLLRQVHSEADVRVSGAASAGHPAQRIQAHVSADCTLHHTSTGAGGAQQAHITGTAWIGSKPPQHIDTYFQFSGSASRTGTNSHYTFRMRSSRTGNRWVEFNPGRLATDPAYTAYSQAAACAGGPAAFNLGSSVRYMFGGTGRVAGLAVWLVNGRLDSHGERFTFHLFVDQRTYRVIRNQTAYTERIDGKLVSSFSTDTVYSRMR